MMADTDDEWLDLETVLSCYIVQESELASDVYNRKIRIRGLQLSDGVAPQFCRSDLAASYLLRKADDVERIAPQRTDIFEKLVFALGVAIATQVVNTLTDVVVRNSLNPSGNVNTKTRQISGQVYLREDEFVAAQKLRVLLYEKEYSVTAVGFRKEFVLFLIESFVNKCDGMSGVEVRKYITDIKVAGNNASDHPLVVPRNSGFEYYSVGFELRKSDKNLDKLVGYLRVTQSSQTANFVSLLLKSHFVSRRHRLSI